MKKSWILIGWIGWIVTTIIIALLVFRPIEKPKKIEQPKKPETAKQQQGEIESPPTATSTAIPESLSLKFYKELPDDIYFCGEHLILDENKKRKLAEILSKNIINYTPETIREMIEKNPWYTYLEKEPTSTDFPEDLKYVPLVESALDAAAHSLKGASGPWQFMENTARQPDLTLRVESENNYDERYDFIKSTKAAKKYLKELHDKFKNWPAALAAYNTGEKNLLEAQDREHTKDFFSLKTIEQETQEYPFRVIATKLILTNIKLAKGELGDIFSQRGWMLSSIAYKNLEVIPLELKLEGRSSIKWIVKNLKISFPNLTEDDFIRYNQQIRGDLPTGTFTAYIINKGTS